MNDNNETFSKDLLPGQKVRAKIDSWLDEVGIDFSLLENTNDKRARDYMPIQVVPGKFVTFKYLPDYLLIRINHRQSQQ